MTPNNLDISLKISTLPTVVSLKPLQEHELYPGRLNLLNATETFTPESTGGAGKLIPRPSPKNVSSAEPTANETAAGQLSLSKRLLAGFMLALSAIGIVAAAGGTHARQAPANPAEISRDIDGAKNQKVKTGAEQMAGRTAETITNEDEHKSGPEVQRLFNAIDSYGQDAVELERGLTSRPAIDPSQGGVGEVKKAEYLKEYMQQTGYTSMEEYKAPDPAVPEGYHPNLVYRFKGRNSDRTIWIMSHLDTVPAGNMSEWHTNPFDATVKGDRIYGRGVEDNQQGIVTSVLAAKALHDTGTIPEHDVGLLFVSNEEMGSEFGIQYCMKQNPNLFNKNDIVIVPDGGNADGTMIEVAEKSIVWLKFSTHGKSAHASRPDLAVNANRAGSAFLLRLNDLYKEYNAQDPIFDPPYSTFEPTKREANVPNVNSIPGEDVFYMDSRILPTYRVPEVMHRIEEMRREIENQYNVKIDINVEAKDEAAPATPVDAPVVKEVEAAIKEVYGVQAKPQGIGGGTVAYYIRNNGIPAVVWNTSDQTEHMPDENVKIGNLLGDAKVFAHVFMQKGEQTAVNR